MTPTRKFCESVRERTELAANWRSDDFGHDCQELLLAESRALQVAADDFAKLLEIVACYEAALEKVWFGDNPKTERVDLDFGAVRSLYTARELSEIAHEALKAADKIAGGGE